MIGKVFSIDAIAKTPSGKTLGRAFVQGDHQDELIPAVGKLADKLTAELLKFTAPASAASAPAAVIAPRSEIIRPEAPVRQAASGEIIRPKDFEQGAAGGWVSKRLNGVINLLATGATRPDGSREVFLAEGQRISCYLQGTEMKPVAEVELGITEKIVSIDTLGPDLYVTVVRSDELSSQVWQLQGGRLVQVAKSLPWFFRSFSLAGGPKKLYAQAMGRDADFFGDVFEASRSGEAITTRNPIRMPRYGSIYSFNQFKAADGALLTVVINPDNYLVVYDQQQKELWRSNDKFGGSELSFQKEDQENIRTTGSKYRLVFLNQKIQVTAKNDVLVGKNDGFWVLGDARSYKKGAVYSLAWNGSSLEEKWRTKDTQNYMPDYWFDEARNELLMLQVVQRPAVFGGDRGASTLSIKKVE